MYDLCLFHTHFHSFVLMSVYSKLGRFFSLLQLHLLRLLSWYCECVNTPNHRNQFVYNPLNNHKNRRCTAHRSCVEETNRQTRKRVEIFGFVFFTIITSLIFRRIHSLSSSMVIIISFCCCCCCCCLFYSVSFSRRERGCAAFTNNTKDFLKSMNGIDCSIFFKRETLQLWSFLYSFLVWLCISVQFTDCFHSFIADARFFLSLHSCWFVDNRFPMIQSKKMRTCAYRSAHSLWATCVNCCCYPFVWRPLWMTKVPKSKLITKIAHFFRFSFPFHASRKYFLRSSVFGGKNQ